MDADELAMHRDNTTAFIAVRPDVLELNYTAPRERTPSGGWKDGAAATRAPQTFRIIELGANVTMPKIKTQDGLERSVEYWLLGEHDAAVEIGDWWRSDDDRLWEVGEIMRPNKYEVRALVVERGQ